MKRIQKISIMMMITFISSIVLAAIAVAVLYYTGVKNAWAGLGLLGFCGIAGLAPLIFKQDDEPCDERDIKIKKDAAMAGFASAYAVGVIGAMAPFTYSSFFLEQGPNTQIGIACLPLLVGAMGISHHLMFSVAILIGYGRNKGDDDE